MKRVSALRLLLVAGAVAGSAVAACGDDSGSSDDVGLEEVTRTTGDDEETTTTGAAADDAAAGGTTLDVDSCLEAAGFERADPADPDLPISAGEGSGPPIVNGAEGIAVRGLGGTAVFFVYDTAGEAAEAASLVGATSDGTVMIVADTLPSGAVDAIVACATGAGAVDTDPGEAGGGSDVNACITAGGVEIVPPDDPGLVVSGPSGEAPVVNGVTGTGARSEGLTAVFFVYDTEAAASQAMNDALSSPDVEQNSPALTVVAFQTVLFLMDIDFPEDAQVVILDCAAPL